MTMTGLRKVTVPEQAMAIAAVIEGKLQELHLEVTDRQVTRKGMKLKMRSTTNNRKFRVTVESDHGRVD